MVLWKPVEEATWRRLAALDARCRLSMWRDEQWLVDGARGKVWSGVGGTPSDPRRKAWRVRIFLRDSIRPMDLIDTAEPHLADALLQAVEEAERRGWARPAPTKRLGRTAGPARPNRAAPDAPATEGER